MRRFCSKIAPRGGGRLAEFTIYKRFLVFYRVTGAAYSNFDNGSESESSTEFSSDTFVTRSGDASYGQDGAQGAVFEDFDASNSLSHTPINRRGVGKNLSDSSTANNSFSQEERQWELQQREDRRVFQSKVRDGSRISPLPVMPSIEQTIKSGASGNGATRGLYRSPTAVGSGVSAQAQLGANLRTNGISGRQTSAAQDSEWINNMDPEWYPVQPLWQVH